MDKQKININLAGSNGYRSAVNDFWDKISEIIDENDYSRSRLFKIYKQLSNKKYIALK